MCDQNPVPITLVSGFLGSGKTTLVQAILKTKAGRNCAVIVNDLASINIDSGVISRSNTLQEGDALVHLENGCVCCDLKDDLLDQVASLATTGRFDNILIEVTGVAEPEGVAASLAGAAARVSNDGLRRARLDTCVTVVDSSMFFKHLHSAKRLRDSELGDGVETDETEELTSQLLVNQVEFADVILLNKTDLLEQVDMLSVKDTLEMLNPSARVIPCSFSQVDVADVLSTNLFSVPNTANHIDSHGTATSGEDDHHGTDTLEHAVTSFVYSARMPFHPARLHAFATRYFQLHQQDWTSALAATAPERAAASLRRTAAAAAAAAASLPRRGGGAHAAVQLAADAARHAAALVAARGARAARDGDPPSASPPPPAAPAKVRAEEAGNVLRSKGFVWLAGPSRHDHCAQWSSAGQVLRVSTGGPWFSALPLEAWPTEPEKQAEIVNDFQPGIGDRRQEIVFIGTHLNEAAIRHALDACLCTHFELLPDPSPHALCSTHTSPVLDAAVDPFAPWPPMSELLYDPDAAEDEGFAASASGGSEASTASHHAMRSHAPPADAPAGEAGRSCGPEHGKVTSKPTPPGNTSVSDSAAQPLRHDSEPEEEDDEEEVELEDAQWMPGEVLDIFAGGSETAASLDAAFAMGLRAVAVLWHAPWVDPSVAAEAELARAAAAHPHVMCLCLTVDASSDNKAFALEIVMAKSKSARRGAHPVLRSGGKWPCITVHEPPMLQPAHTFEGAGAAAELLQHLESLPAWDESVHGDGASVDAPTDAGAPAGSPEAPAEMKASAETRPGGRSAPAVPRTVGTIKRGVADLKPLLASPAVAGGAPFLVLIEDASTGSSTNSRASAEPMHALRALWHDATGAHGDVVFATLDTSASEANRALASKLGATACPALMARHAGKTTIVPNLTPGSLTSTLARCSSVPAAAPATPSTAHPPEASGKTASARKASVYDPPEGHAKRPGAYKAFAGKGQAVYWPRMPCLRCGCPWWLGEDWDALCVRCGWCCESEGYDNDSRPLTTGGWLERYEKFTACIKEGTTAPWPPAGGSGKGKGRGAVRG